MKSYQKILSLFLIILSTACTNPQLLSEKNIIPIPVLITNEGKFFELNYDTEILMNTIELESAGNFLTQILRTSTGFKLENKLNVNHSQGAINLCIDNSKTNWNKEEYQLKINSENIILIAKKPEGIFRGIQTLRQLFPPQIESKTKQEFAWNIPTGTIQDYPKYEFRGAMLDVARHFFTVNEVKRYIDLLALYKINHLHLHLSDDQGWRIEIKSWPKLTEIGGTSSVNNEKAGFYTQNDYTELQNYAAERYITIIPEIDLPGHTNAALASYPELNHNNMATELYTGIEVGFSSLAIHKPITYNFVDDVIRELSALTIGDYIHIGGDESHSTKHDDYVYFINKTLAIVAKHHKKAIGWDEMAHANVNSNHTVQFWSNKANTSLAIEKGAQVIFSPAQYAYLDMKYDSTTKLGLDWAGTIEVDKAYQWIPDTIIPNLKAEQILGIEAPLWSETLLTNADIEYLAFPRICGIAEIGWSQNSALIWDDYNNRLSGHKERFEILNINFYRSLLIQWNAANNK